MATTAKLPSRLHHTAYVTRDLEATRKFYEELIGLPLVARFVSYDVVDDPDPEMGAKIAALHQRRYENDAELTQLVTDLAGYEGSAAPGAHGES